MQSNSSEEVIKIKIFQTIQKNLAVVGLNPSQQQQQNNHRKLSLRQITFVVVTAIDAISIFSSIFIGINGIEEYMDIIFSLTADVGVLVAYISLIFQMDKGFNTIERCDEELTYRSMRNLSSHAIHEKTNRLVEKLSKIIYFVITKFGLLGVMLPKAFISYLIYFTANAGNNTFKLPFPVWTPFDANNPVGYFFAIIWQSVLTFPIIIFLANVVTLGIGCFLFTLSFAKDWKSDLQTIDEMIITKQSKVDIFEHVVEFVRSHSNFKELLNDFKDLFKVCIFADVSCCTITLCVIMLIVQVEIISKDIIDPGILWKSCLLFSISFGLIFLSCEIGHRLTNTFEEINYDFEQLAWYLFPNEVQKMLSTILIGVQEPVSFESYGIVDISREQFKKMFSLLSLLLLNLH